MKRILGRVPADTGELKAAPAAVKPSAPKEAPSDYILGAEDQISLWSPEAEELNGKALRVEYRIRFVLNGVLISDWREPKPELIKEGPIGLQLHSNKVPQEVQFKNLTLEVFPEDKLTTVKD